MIRWLSVVSSKCSIWSINAPEPDYARARAYFLEASRRNPYHTMARSNLGATLKREGKLEEAIEAYKQSPRGRADSR